MRAAGLRLEGVETARPTAAVLAAMAEAELLVIGPSNPLVSIGPILALPGMREAVAASPAWRVGVSGIVAGILGALVMTLVNWVIHAVIGR